MSLKESKFSKTKNKGYLKKEAKELVEDAKRLFFLSRPDQMLFAKIKAPFIKSIINFK